METHKDPHQPLFSCSTLSSQIQTDSHSCPEYLRESGEGGGTLSRCSRQIRSCSTDLGSFCTGTTHQHFSSHSLQRFPPSLRLWVLLCRSRGFSRTELACAAVLFVYVSQGLRVLLLALLCSLAWMQLLSRPELAPNDKSCSGLMQHWGRYK